MPIGLADVKDFIPASVFLLFGWVLTLIAWIGTTEGVVESQDAVINLLLTGFASAFNLFTVELPSALVKGAGYGSLSVIFTPFNVFALYSLAMFMFALHWASNG